MKQVTRQNALEAIGEAALIRRSQAGDVAAFGELVVTYQDRLFNVCLRTIGDRSAAEDLSQEAFVRAFTAIRRFDGRASLYTWLFRIAVNLCLSERRSILQERGRRRAAGGEPGGPTPQELPSPEGGPASKAAVREEHGLVLAALDGLDPDHRAVVVLRDIESLDYAEIAEILDVAVGTVKSRLHRARLLLRERLAPILGNE